MVIQRYPNGQRRVFLLIYYCFLLKCLLSTIKINFSPYNQNITFITDGQLHEPLSTDDTVLITNSDFEIGLIDFSDNDYFQTLRTKMGWGTRGNSN